MHFIHIIIRCLIKIREILGGEGILRHYRSIGIITAKKQHDLVNLILCYSVPVYNRAVNVILVWVMARLTILMIGRAWLGLWTGLGSYNLALYDSAKIIFLLLGLYCPMSHWDQAVRLCVAHVMLFITDIARDAVCSSSLSTES